jgi:16S rRNA (uracil1498-N3)-methyltransferase
MSQNRFYTPTLTTKQNSITIDGFEHNHLFKVVRKRIGDRIECINGMGFVFEAEITEQTKQSTIADIVRHQFEIKSTPLIRLVCAICRPQYISDIIEKSTELGVDQLVFYPSDNSKQKEVSLSQHKRWDTILISSLKQCDRLYKPKLEIKKKFDELDFITSDVTLFGSLTKNKHIDSVTTAQHGNRITFLCGPESGFTDREEMSFLRQGFHPTRIHKNTLRACTAASFGVGLIYYLTRYRPTNETD